MTILKSIFYDLMSGFVDSLRFDLVFNKMQINPKLYLGVKKIIKYNLSVYLIPFIVVHIINYLTSIDLNPVFNYIYVIIGIISGVFHLFCFIDLIDIVCTYTNRWRKKYNKLDPISLTILMFIYQLSIYFIVEIIDLLFYTQFGMLTTIIKFGVLTIYHSFHCFNNLWHYKKIDIHHRIDFYEKMWAYYVGYGIILSIIYLYCNYIPIIGLYNICTSVTIIIPFIVKSRYPNNGTTTYPKINLRLFSIVMGYVGYIIKYFNQNQHIDQPKLHSDQKLNP